MLSMTAAHVVNPWDSSTTRWRNKPVYSPRTLPGAQPNAADRIAVVDYVFPQKSCGNLLENPALPVDDPARWIYPEACHRRYHAKVNLTYESPDIGLISYGWRSVPFNDPEGASPVRRMQYGTTKSVRGPSGRVKMPEIGDKHKIWGSRTAAAGTGRVVVTDTCVNFFRVPSSQRQAGDQIYRYCGANMLNLRTQPGDSGSLVAYKGEGKHYIAGVLFGFGTVNGQPRSIYTPADHVLRALTTAGRAVSNFWGTYPDYQRPATDDGDD